MLNAGLLGYLAWFGLGVVVFGLLALRIRVVRNRQKRSTQRPAHHASLRIQLVGYGILTAGGLPLWVSIPFDPPAWWIMGLQVVLTIGILVLLLSQLRDRRARVRSS